MNKKLMLTLVIGLVCKDGYVKDKSAEVCVQVAAAVKPSDEKPPKDKMPSYQREGIAVITIRDLPTADKNHPASCAANCVWTDVQCICNQDPSAAKKP